MKHGDFTELAKFYVDRPGYSSVLLNCLKAYIMNTLEGRSWWQTSGQAQEN